MVAELVAVVLRSDDSDQDVRESTETVFLLLQTTVL